MITQEEQWALNILTAATADAQTEFKRRASARSSYIELLEAKYDIVFDDTTGQFKAKEKKQ